MPTEPGNPVCVGIAINDSLARAFSWFGDELVQAARPVGLSYRIRGFDMDLAVLSASTDRIGLGARARYSFGVCGDLTSSIVALSVWDAAGAELMELCRLPELLGPEEPGVFCAGAAVESESNGDGG